MGKYVRAIKDFSGGLSEVANDNIPDNRLVKAMNAVPGDGYGIARVSGTTLANRIPDALGPVVMLTEMEESGVVHFIACTENGGYWNMWDWDGTEWSAVEVDSEADILPMRDWFVYANKLFWLDGLEFRYYDGTEVATVQPAYEATNEFWEKVQEAVAVEQRSTRWFFATKDNEIIVSEVGYYNKFTETNIFNITSGVSDKITALHQFNDGILIFQQRAVFYFSGWDLGSGTDIKLARLNVESGTRWPKTVKTVSNAVLYLGDNGLYRLSVPYYSSSIASRDLSDKQASRRLTDPTATDIYAEVYNGVYYITLRTPTGVREYRLFLDTGAWWGEFTQQPYCYSSKLAGDEHLFIGCDNGYILKYDSNSRHYISTETGGITSIPVEIVTKGYDVVGRTVIDSKVKRVFIVLKQYDAERSGLEVQVKTDYLEGAWAAKVDSMRQVLTAVLEDVSGDESLVYAEGEWANAYWGWIDTVTKMFRFNRKCKRIQFTFRDDNSDEPLLVYAIGLQYKRKKAKGSRLGVTERTITYKD